MSGKKKKFNSRFPPARIKKMMQSDEDVGKVAWVVPCLISKALEIFSEQLMMTISDEIQSRNARTLSTTHIKAAIKLKDEFLAVRELADGETNYDSSEFADGAIDGETSPKKRKYSADDQPQPPAMTAPMVPIDYMLNAPSGNSQPPDQPPIKRGRGRPRKHPIDESQTAVCSAIEAAVRNFSNTMTSSHHLVLQSKHIVSSKTRAAEEFDEEDDDEEDDDDDDEDYH